MTFPARKSKYGNRKVIVDNIVFDSKKEAARYGQLKLLERAGQIKGLELQRKFPLVVEGKRVCTFICDFYYFEDGKYVVEDVKSPATRTNRAYRIKNKLFAAIYGYEITEV